MTYRKSWTSIFKKPHQKQKIKFICAVQCTLSNYQSIIYRITVFFSFEFFNTVISFFKRLLLIREMCFFQLMRILIPQVLYTRQISAERKYQMGCMIKMDIVHYFFLLFRYTKKKSNKKIHQLKFATTKEKALFRQNIQSTRKSIEKRLRYYPNNNPYMYLAKFMLISEYL